MNPGSGVGRGAPTPQQDPHPGQMWTGPHVWGCAGLGDPPDAHPRAGTLHQGLLWWESREEHCGPTFTKTSRRSSSGSQCCSGGLRRWGVPPGDTSRDGPRLWAREGSGMRRVNRPSKRHRSRAAISLEDALARVPSRVPQPGDTPSPPKSPEQRTDAARSWKPHFLGEPADYWDFLAPRHPLAPSSSGWEGASSGGCRVGTGTSCSPTSSLAAGSCTSMGAQDQNHATGPQRLPGPHRRSTRSLDPMPGAVSPLSQPLLPQEFLLHGGSGRFGVMLGGDTKRWRCPGQLTWLGDSQCSTRSSRAGGTGTKLKELLGVAFSLPGCRLQQEGGIREHPAASSGRGMEESSSWTRKTHPPTGALGGPGPLQDTVAQAGAP